MTGGAFSITAATQAGKLDAIVSAFVCPDPEWRDEQDTFDWTRRPIPMSFGNKEDLGVFAAVGFTNFILVVLIACVHMFVAFVVYHMRLRRSYDNKSFHAAKAVVQYPSFLLFPVLFFYQTIVTSSLKVIMYSPSLSLRMVGALTFLVVGLGVPVYTYIVIGPGFKCTWEPAKTLPDEEEKKVGALRRLFRYKGDWKSKDVCWLEGYSMFFDEFRGGCHWWLFVDLFFIFSLAVIDGLEPETKEKCVGTSVASLALFFGQFALVVYKRPFINVFLNGFFIVAYALQFTSMLLVTVAVLGNKGPNFWGTIASVNMLLYFSGMLLLKLVIDILRFMNDRLGIDKAFVGKSSHTFRPLTQEEEENVFNEMSVALREDFLQREEACRKETMGLALQGEAVQSQARKKYIEHNTRLTERDRRVIGDLTAPTASKSVGGALAFPVPNMNTTSAPPGYKPEKYLAPVTPASDKNTASSATQQITIKTTATQPPGNRGITSVEAERIAVEQLNADRRRYRKIGGDEAADGWRYKEFVPYDGVVRDPRK